MAVLFRYSSNDAPSIRYFQSALVSLAEIMVMSVKGVTNVSIELQAYCGFIIMKGTDVRTVGWTEGWTERSLIGSLGTAV